ncbi:MAG: response regulator [Acidobacteria bacterium]|nr:response regulator [Acidobacteriota bacterium]
MAQDPYKYFRVEARDLLEELSQGVLALEKGTGTPDLIPRLLRLAHTLKGAARVVKQREIADQAHAVEDALAPFRESSAPLPQEGINTVLGLLDKIDSHVTALIPPSDMEAAAPATPLPEEALRTVRADITEMDALLNGITETHAQIWTLRKSLGSAQRARSLADLLLERLAPRRGQRNGEPGNALTGDKTQALAEDLRAVFAGFERDLNSSLDQMDRELRQVRDAAERLRLVAAGALFTSLARTARDTALALGKRVVFEGRGGDVRLDAHVLGAIQGALLQLVRNAVAHGIELEADRRAAGKPADGRVTLEVARLGRRVSFTCKDDGRGVDLEAVRLAAQRKGLLSSDMQKLGAQDLLHLLLDGGLSTSGAVTEVSGRGIGLDVVREAAQRLGGVVSVRTEAGKGTTVELIVPLSIASLAALVVECSGVAAAIPLDAVRGAIRLAPGDIAKTANGEAALYEGKAVPFVSLPRTLGQVGVGSARGARPWSTVIVEAAGGLAAVGVDRFLGTVNAVLRPLPDLAPSTPVVAGASLDAAGNPQLVLDPDGLIAEAQRTRVLEAEPEAPGRRVLVIDDSLTTRMLEQSILESAGYQVEIATSGEEALDKARRNRYALFLVDIEMPGMDGFTFIERTQADPTLREIPAILVTSRSSPEDRRRGEEIGAVGYIAKSEFDQAELLERIGRLVE